MILSSCNECFFDQMLTNKIKEMRIFRTLEEVIDYAIDKEMDEIKFYSNLANRMKKTNLKALIRDIAIEKTGRMFCLERMKDVKSSLKLNDLGDIPLDLSSIDQDYVEKNLNDWDVLVLVMEKEKAKFKFYFDMSNMATNAECKETFLNLADEEARRKLKFELLYDEHVCIEN